MINYLFNKNSNLNFFKSRLSQMYLVFENKVFFENLREIFKEHLNFNSDKIILKSIPLEDLPLLGAAELVFKGWHAEAIPYAQEKKSLFAGIFSRFFQ